MIGTSKKSGFSLMEVIVSVALFSVIILSSTEIFRLVIIGQREAIASQNVQESLKYFFEVTVKEIRMARRNDGSCSQIPTGNIFTVSSNSLGDILYFKNYYGECVSYQLTSDEESNRFEISRGSNSGFISPAKINIENLRFSLDSSEQPIVTILFDAHAVGEEKFASEMTVQTTVTSRYYR